MLRVHSVQEFSVHVYVCISCRWPEWRYWSACGEWFSSSVAVCGELPKCTLFWSALEEGCWRVRDFNLLIHQCFFILYINNIYILHLIYTYTVNANLSFLHSGEPRTVWRRDKSGLEFRPVGKDTSQVHCPAPNFGKGDFSLHIEGVKEEDGGLYLCILEHSQTVFKNVMLRVVKGRMPSQNTHTRNISNTCSSFKLNL